jgi:hypothetical protein
MKEGETTGRARRRPFGAEAFDPFSDGLWCDVELAPGGGFRQPAIDNRATIFPRPFGVKGAFL